MDAETTPPKTYLGLDFSTQQVTSMSFLLLIINFYYYLNYTFLSSFFIFVVMLVLAILWLEILFILSLL